MVDINIRKALDELAKDKYPDKEIIILDNPSFDKSIIGLIGEEDQGLYTTTTVCARKCAMMTASIWKMQLSLSTITQ